MVLNTSIKAATVRITQRDHPFSTYAKFSKKTNISYPHIQMQRLLEETISHKRHDYLYKK